MAADEHPLPWRWVDGADGPGGAATALIDATGTTLLHSTDSLSPPEVDFASPYVRAVTERAGALEQVVRDNQWAATSPDTDCGGRSICPECQGMAPGAESYLGERVGHYDDCAIGTLLAEIDAAKAGVEPPARAAVARATDADLCGGRCNKFGCDTPCDQLPGHVGICSCRNRRIKAVLDAGTCATCRAADGLIAAETPACEHVANGAGTCRCVLVQAKAGG